MALAPLWDQSYDRNHSRVSEFDSYNSTTRTWLREGGDWANDTGSKGLVNGSHHASETDSSTDSIKKTNMSYSGPSDSLATVGDNVSRPQEDHITSIHDNPFYKSFGVRHPRSPRDIPPLAPFSRIPDADSGLAREDLGDYKPGSGFVNKLRGKFVSLSVRDNVQQPFHVKQTSSLEDVNGEGKLGDEGAASGETEISPRERPRQRYGIMSYGAKNRAKSVDSINHTRRKPHLPVTLRHVERKWEHPATATKSPRDSHIVAPDVTLARDDIILIEKTPAQPPPSNEEIDGDDVDGQLKFQVASFKAEMPSDELPKPNTVSTVRNFFESASHVDADIHGRSNKPLSPTSVHSCLEQTSGDKENRDYLASKDPPLTPRDPLPTPREPTPREPVSVLTPRDSSSSSSSTPRESVTSPRSYESSYKPFDFSKYAPKSRYSRTGDVKAAGSSDVSTLPSSTQSSQSSSSTQSSSAAVSVTAEANSDDVRTVSDAAGSSALSVSGSTESSRPLVSPRSTAAVKAVPANRPPIPSRPTRPISASLPSSGSSVPPSFTPSIKKTSPVMPVAPFKDKADDEDENRHLVYAKKKSGTRPRSTRVKDYGESAVESTTDTVKQKIEETDKMEVESEVEKTNKVNLSHSKGRAPPAPKPQTEKDVTPVTTFKKVEKMEDVHLDLSKPTSPRIEESEPQSAEPVQKAPTAAPRSYFSNARESERPTIKTAVETDSSSVQNDEPVRGIPSIIAKRMKQNAAESSDAKAPDELFGVRLGKTRHTDTGDDGSEIPHKRLAATPASEKKDNATSNLPSEIENQIASVRNRMQASSKNRSSGVSQIFDSSQLAKKRKEKQEAKKRANVNVPRLDLTSITSDEGGDPGATGGYRVTPREIKPCNIEFIGANVSVGRSLLAKNRKVKINIRFHDILVKTFEYPSEEHALEEYMHHHPNEVLVLDDVAGPAESSDDLDILDTPRGTSGGLESELLKSNTALSHSGSLQSYRGKYQQEYVLGSVMTETEKPREQVVEAEPVDPDSMQLRPADEDDLDTWSTSTTSDLLF